MSIITIIIPIFEVEPFIRRCLDSVLWQTVSAFYLLIINDGSSDKSGATCEDYAVKDSRIKLVHQTNRGLSFARNVGIDLAWLNSGDEWLSFIDGDDWIAPKMLDTLLQSNLRNHTQVAACGYKETDRTEPIIEVTSLTSTVVKTESFFVEHNTNATVVWGKLFAKECFTDIRFPVGKIHEDDFTTYKVVFRFPHVSYTPSPLYCYFKNPNGITRSPWTPAHIASIEAIERQLSFFLNNDYAEAYRFTCRRYVNQLGYFCILTIKQYPSLYRSLYEKLQLSYRHYRMSANMTFDNCPYAFSAMYPFFTRLYRRWRHLKEHFLCLFFGCFFFIVIFPFF